MHRKESHCLNPNEAGLISIASVIVLNFPEILAGTPQAFKRWVFLRKFYVSGYIERLRVTSVQVVNIKSKIKQKPN